jgi:light-regulated signal transduction histidine kinase (bacteriophytochrome)
MQNQGQDPDDLGKILHDMRQPISVVRVVTRNIRRRCTPALDDESAQYLNAKLNQIDEQLQRLLQNIESMDNTSIIEK